MTPLTTNPNVVVLVDINGDVLATATNVAPDLLVKVIVNVDDACRTDFDTAAEGLPFNTLNN